MKRKSKNSSEWAGNKAYITQRKKLIPIAVAHANIVAPGYSQYNHSAWDNAFHKEMTRLAHERLGCPL